LEAPDELAATVMVVWPGASRSTVSPGASVTVSLFDEIGVEGCPFTWYCAEAPAVEVLNKLWVPSLS
jgi:threonine/homoserine efflux transporter RhtA